MKRAFGLVAVASAVAAYCGTSQTFAAPDLSSGAVYCVGNLSSSIESTFKYEASLCWKNTSPGVWGLFVKTNLVLPVLYVGGKGATPSGGGTYTGNWAANHCPASGAVQTFLKNSSYGAVNGAGAAVNPDTTEVLAVLANYGGTFQVFGFDPSGVNAPKNQGDCCVQNGTTYSGLSVVSPTNPGAFFGQATCP